MTDSAANLQFFRGFLAKPFSVAAPIPSGRKLAEAIAREVDPEPGGIVVELGPGTGSVTEALLERVAPSDLVAIESDPDFVVYLRTRFATATILEGNAYRFRDILRDRGIGRSCRSIVSGLPVLNRPSDIKQKLLGTAIEMLRPGAPFIQFSYGVTPPIRPIEGVKVRRAAIVWQNFPPMHVWVYRAAAD